MRTTIPIYLFLLSFPCLLFSQHRDDQLINFDWKFKLGEQVGANQSAYNDTSWKTVDLPHDASIGEAFVMDDKKESKANGFLPRNIGWYRKNLVMNQDLKNKKVILEFEGVYRDAKVWLNGKQIGTHLNGYLDFEFDITKELIQGNNVIAVRYDNTYNVSSRWYTGEGINRNVWLHVLDNLHVDRYGTYVTTPMITDKLARVKLETTVENSYKDSLNCRLKSEILSPDGKVVASTVSVVPMAGNGKFTFRQELNILNPQLWDIESPQLYRVKTYIYNKQELKDSYETPFGVRDVVMNAEEGLVLNGKKVFVKGVCLHHDLGPLGAAAFEAGYKRRLEGLKQLGCNGIRLSHNPYPKYVLQWCDENGMLVFDEAYDKWNSQYYGEGANFEDFWRTDVETWLKRDRNHPSVFIWSVGNEVQQTRTKVYNFKTKKQEIDSTRGVTLYTAMYDFVHGIEPSRKITMALFPTRYNGIRANEPGYKEAGPAQTGFYGDVMSVNYMEKYFAYDRESYPQLSYIVSEASTGTGGYSFCGYDHKTAVGQFYWGGTEYIGESFKWPSKGWINGIIDLCDNVKPVGYSIKAFYSEKPMVQLVVLDKTKQNDLTWNDLKMSSSPMFIHWNWADAKQLDVLTFSNCEEVELILNSKSLGRRKMADFPQQRMLWKVDYQEGEIMAIGFNNGLKVSENVLKTASTPYQIVLKPEKKTLLADGLDLLYFNVEVLDKAGNLVPTNDINVKFNVSGAANIAGVGNGNILSDESWQANNRTVYQGKALLILRAKRDAGEIVVKATADKLKGDVFKMKSVK